MTSTKRETRSVRRVRNRVRYWARRASDDLSRLTTNPTLRTELMRLAERIEAELIAHLNA